MIHVSIEPGILYVVATPIGNLEDMSPRGLRILREVDRIAAEDTRHSQRLLTHFGIGTPLISLHEHNERIRIQGLLAELRMGKSIALISDAGTPLISDPGYQLVKSARAEGLRVAPVPGPSSFLAALSVAGLPTDRFVFEGFLPAKPSARQARLENLEQEPRTLVFFEAGHRIQDSLAAMAAAFGGNRQAVVARELTKLFEEVKSDVLLELCKWIAADDNRRRGEFVILVQGAPEPAEAAIGPEARRLLTVLLEELPVKKAAALAAKLSGLPKNALYARALELKNLDSQKQ